MQKLRSILWPIYGDEIKKIIPMFFMLLLLSFNQSTLWNLKDSLVITAAGAEIIPFIKVWAILPSAIILTSIFAYLSNRFSQEKVFYLLTGAFLLFYALFAFVIYPARDLLHPVESAAYLEHHLPAGFKGLIALYRYWTFTSFYVACELWNTIVISVLFWSFVNAVTRTSEGGRFYGVLGIAYNAGIIAAGGVAIVLAKYCFAEWQQTLQILMLVIIANGAVAMGLFCWMQRDVPNGSVDVKQKKEKLSLIESIRYVSRSKYLICIAVMVVAYSLVINLVEVVWKDQLKTLCPAALDYHHYINNMQVVQGTVALVLSLAMTGLIKRLGWTKTALITPVVMLLLCGFFFSSLLVGALPLIVFIGAIQNSLCKACKYSLFDATKEMAFIPLTNESKLMGKTAIDGIGVRFGKSGGSFIHQGLLLLFASISASAPYVGVIILVVLFYWILSTRNIGAAAEGMGLKAQ